MKLFENLVLSSDSDSDSDGTVLVPKPKPRPKSSLISSPSKSKPFSSLPKVINQPSLNLKKKPFLTTTSTSNTISKHSPTGLKSPSKKLIPTAFSSSSSSSDSSSSEDSSEEPSSSEPEIELEFKNESTDHEELDLDKMKLFLNQLSKEVLKDKKREEWDKRRKMNNTSRSGEKLRRTVVVKKDTEKNNVVKLSFKTPITTSDHQPPQKKMKRSPPKVPIEFNQSNFHTSSTTDFQDSIIKLGRTETPPEELEKDILMKDIKKTVRRSELELERLRMKELEWKVGGIGNSASSSNNGERNAVASGSGTREWICTRCTFSNPAGFFTCEVCRADR